jgi:hypothetical protein
MTSSTSMTSINGVVLICGSGRWEVLDMADLLEELTRCGDAWGLRLPDGR